MPGSPWSPWQELLFTYFFSMVYKNLTELIGHTPLVEIGPFEGQRARILAKVEFFNPGGSVKDRVALAMI